MHLVVTIVATWTRSLRAEIKIQRFGTCESMGESLVYICAYDALWGLRIGAVTGF